MGLGAMLISNLAVSDLAAWFVGGAVAWYVVTAFMSYYRLRHIPAPFLARFSYTWHLFKFALNGQNGPLYEQLHDRYANGGPFVQIAPNYVVTNDPEAWRHVGANKNNYPRDEWWLAGQVHPDHKSMICVIEIDEHDKMKAKTASGYSGREVGAEFETAIDEQVGELVAYIRRKHLSTQDDIRPVDMAALVRFFTLDVITRLGYGKPWGHLKNGEDVYGYCGTVDSMLKFIGLLLDVPPLRRLVFNPIGLRLLGPKTTDKAGPGRVMGAIHELVSERFKPENKSKIYHDMVGGFMRNGMNQEEIEGEANVQILAGSDTTATTLCSAFLYLSTTPHAYMAMKHVVRSALSSGLCHPDKPITFEAALQIPYLQAVIWESLRIRFPVNYGHYKSVPKGGDTIMGVYLPEGTAVGHNALAITRNKEIFGRDVHLFRPERFMEGTGDCDAETKAVRIKAIDGLFGGGRWTCSGKQIAWYELSKAIFELMRQFDLQVANNKKAWSEEHYGTPRYINALGCFYDADWSVY